MMAILLEHTSGKWPFWLSPRQSVILPVTDDHYDYAKQVHAQLQKQRFVCNQSVSAPDCLVVDWRAGAPVRLT
jgi:threonyl-tRNA synthetase